jgi:hypothetical protein
MRPENLGDKRSTRHWFWERGLMWGIVLAAWVNAAVLLWSLHARQESRPHQEWHGLSKVSILTTRPNITPLERDGHRRSGA